MNFIQPRPCHRSSPAATVAVIATLDEPDAAGGGIHRGLPERVSWVQVRADRIGDIPPVGSEKSLAASSSTRWEAARGIVRVMGTDWTGAGG